MLQLVPTHSPLGEPFSESQKAGHAESSGNPAKGLLSCYLCYLLDLRSDMSSLSFDMVASQDLGGFAQAMLLFSVYIC